MEILGTLFGKYFKNRYSIIVAILIGIIVSVNIYYNSFSNLAKIILILCIVGIDAYYIIDTLLYNKLPKNKTGNAVVIRIIAKDKSEYDDIKYKFGNEFEKFLNLNESKIKILYIPFNLVERNNFTEKDKIIKLLKKTNCIFLTTIKLRSEDIRENTKYITEFNLGIIHPVYIDKIERIFQNEIDILGYPTSRVEYFKEDKLNKLEITAQRISIVCKYIIARAYYFSNKFEEAREISENLYNEYIYLSDENFDEIKKSICRLCYEIHIAKVAVENSKINKNIDYIERELDEANKYIKNTYTYYELKSVCCFLKSRDIKKTQYYLGCCKQLKSNAPWKYSKAFLKAYCNESEGKIIYLYKQAFKVPYNHMLLISFIEDIIDQEPDKNRLRFALLLLYLKIGEIKTARSILEEYLEKENNYELNKDVVIQLKKIYGNKVIERLICKEK